LLLGLIFKIVIEHIMLKNLINRINKIHPTSNPENKN
jgi:hypothetical protein